MTESSGSAMAHRLVVHQLNPWVVLMLCLVLAACSHWRDSYFDDGVGVLTQSDIKGKLGKPHIVKDPLLSDKTTWTYRFAVSESELDPSGVKALGKQAGSLMGGAQGGPREKVYCFMYVLTFDKEEILRHWERELCQIPQPPDPFQRGLSG
ncbi:hypothetical protein [Candidatus Nitrospira allomarina]|jgi:hypothetical protein|uniref:Uncharacterized protein n=1 Tax=Candidatus Nitrospira allomarina TaxID=3020900 RepID=A0AA96JYN1_9BACT|nr:hypothetical protein [Candidatus Nitrospira allomarina]WNM57779.1 hypothetical protein PP769_17680 [Candidatus Nitrospira allomarina]